MNLTYKYWLPVTMGAILLGQITTASAQDNKWNARGGGGGGGKGAAPHAAAAPSHVAAPRMSSPGFSAPRMASPRVNTPHFNAPRTATHIATPTQHTATPRSFATTSRNLNRSTARTNTVTPTVNRNALNRSTINRNALTNSSTLNRGNRNLALRNNATPNATTVPGTQNRFNGTNRNFNRNNVAGRNAAVAANRNFAAVNSPRNVNSAQFTYRAGRFHPGWNPANTYTWNNHHWRCYNGVWAVIDVGWPSDWYGYPYPFAYDNTVYYDGDTYEPDSVVISQPVAVGSSMVADVQADLSNMGYNPGPSDGVDGPQTQSAIAQYQQDNGMAPTGQIDGPLLDSLGL